MNIINRILCLFTYSAIVSLVLCVRLFAVESIGFLEKKVGNVSIQRAGEQSSVPISKGMELFVGDKVNTGENSKALIKLSDGSIITLAEETSIKLSRFVLKDNKRDTIINIFKGAVRAIVNTKKGLFKIETKNSIAGVKGTDFTVVTKGKAAFYFMNKGEIEVSSGSAHVVLRENMMTKVFKDRKPVEPVSINNNRELEQAVNKLFSITSIEIPAFLNESEYLEEMLARWTINYAHYLSDLGSSYDAETLLKIAIELTTRDSVRSEILLQTANIYSQYLKNPSESFKYYDEIIKKYPHSLQYETALYNAALSLYEINSRDMARKYFDLYMEKFPDGRYRYGVEYYIRK